MPDAIELDFFVSPYCPRCDATLENLAALTTVGERPLTIRKLDVIEHLDAAVAAGVRTTPALVLNGRLVASGSVTPKRLSRILQSALPRDSKHDTHHR